MEGTVRRTRKSKTQPNLFNSLLGLAISALAITGLVQLKPNIPEEQSLLALPMPSNRLPMPFMPGALVSSQIRSVPGTTRAQELVEIVETVLPTCNVTNVNNLTAKQEACMKREIAKEFQQTNQLPTPTLIQYNISK